MPEQKQPETPGFTRPTPPDGVVISQTDAIKAMTHPLRLRLLDLFRAGVELTATQCAERTGESVASCSFHLRQLEKYGHVERAEAHGKERPWRAVGRGFSVRPDLADPESWPAATAFGSMFIAEQFGRLQRWLADAQGDDPDWVYATTQTHQEYWVTRDELDDLSRRMEELTKPFRGRMEDPSKRPPGARRAHLFGAVWSEIPDPADESEVSDSAEEQA
ncbi:helix-turn-helix domain-containing protein [Promicromonospora sp. NPDC057138]|uniref:helix-turn-helix domain-containing protein n=1 Tax=Promicromonospora sp. NPDC057138 TaxID=3346031 RepID=UPI0036313835